MASAPLVRSLVGDYRLGSSQAFRWTAQGGMVGVPTEAGTSRKRSLAFERLRNLSLRTAAWGLLLLVLTVVAYLPAFRAGWVWDDDVYITSNRLLTAPDGLWRIWFSTDSPSQYFPLVYTMFRVEYTIWELNPLGYHVVNVLLHGLNALVLWRLLTRLRVPGSWLAAAIFALHPVQVESVAWVTEGKNTLSTFLSLATLWVWLTGVEGASGRRIGAYLASLLLFAAALFAKTTACTLPAAQVVILWWRRELSVRRFLGILPFFTLSISMGILTIWWERYHQGSHGPLYALTGVQAVLVAGRAVFFYLGKLVWPSPLVFSYHRFPIDGAALSQWAWPILGVVLAAVLWAIRNRLGRAPFAALAFFVVTLSPLLGFIPLYTFRYSYVADHYQYFACIGPITLFAAGAVWFTEGAGSAGRRLGFGAAAVLLSTLAALSFQQSRTYRDSETLWRATLERDPDCFLANTNLGNILMNRYEFEAALSHYRAAAESRPDDFLSANNLAYALATGPEGLRNPAEAVVLAERAARATRYSSPLVLRTLAAAYAGVGRFEDAVHICERGIQIARLVGDRQAEFYLQNELSRAHSRMAQRTERDELQR